MPLDWKTERGKYAVECDAEALEILRSFQNGGWGGSIEFDGHIHGPSWVAHIGQWEGIAETPLAAVQSAKARALARSPITEDHAYGLDNDDPYTCCDRPREAHPTE